MRLIRNIWGAEGHVVRAELREIASDWRWVALGLIGVVAGSGRAAEPLPDGTSGAVVFAGLDVALQTDDDACLVVNMDGDFVDVMRDGHPVHVRLSGPQTFKTTTEVKVGRMSLNLSDISASRTTHDARSAQDGLDQYLTRQFVHEHGQVHADRAVRYFVAQEERIERADTVPQPFQVITPEERAAAKTGLADAVGAEVDAYSAGPLRGYAPDAGLNRGGAGGSSNAFAITFRAASPVPVKKTYALVRVIVRDPRAPATPLSSLGFYALPRIGPTARRIDLVQTGLPPGFAVDEYEVHIYIGGSEIPTSLSSHRIQVTADEAVQFLLTQYLSGNPAVDRPIRAVPALMPLDFCDHVPVGERGRTFDIDVDAQGVVTRLDLQPGATGVDEAYLDKTLREVRFLPALLHGVPVASTGRFALSELMPPR